MFCEQLELHGVHMGRRDGSIRADGLRLVAVRHLYVALGVCSCSTVAARFRAVDVMAAVRSEHRLEHVLRANLFRIAQGLDHLGVSCTMTAPGHRGREQSKGTQQHVTIRHHYSRADLDGWTSMHARYSMRHGMRMQQHNTFIASIDSCMPIVHADEPRPQARSRAVRLQ